MVFLFTGTSYLFANLSAIAGEIRLMLKYLNQCKLMSQHWSHFDLQMTAILFWKMKAAKLQGMIE
jgi:hypothetical protein